MRNPIDSQLNFARSIKLMFKGFCMGIADIIPGISGGTIAFILGIYEDFVDSLKSFDFEFFKKVLSLKFKEAINHAAWQFLLTLLAGIITAVLIFSKLISWLFINKPILLQSFFFGLILATAPIIGRHVKDRTPLAILSILISAIVAYFFVGLVPFETPIDTWFIFLSGFCALSAFILPGISGAFVLVLLGKYQFIVQAVNDRNLATLFIFLAGGVTGILSIVRFLSWLLHHHHNKTMAVLTGLVIGSLRKIWPWKEIVESIVTSKGKVIPTKVINTLPASLDSEVCWAIGLMVIGFAAAFLLDLFGSKDAKF